ncbi:MAG: DUF177 domain-containing protein [Lentisphaerae bacterium]|jgi:uncharacterized metal-binding protein YceD (DUF177 family)|nr:DUF177 domain-containing protein [Lentisphaerota bacterium]
MILQLANIDAEGSSFKGEDPIEAFEWVKGATDIVHPSGPLKWKLDVKLFGSELFVEGEVSAVFSGICSRCGEDMTIDVSEAVCFSEEVSSQMSEVDLTSELRDAILLALPNHPICGVDCEGFCPTCRKPLSDGADCGCGDDQWPSPWDSLDGLLE